MEFSRLASARVLDFLAAQAGDPSLRLECDATAHSIRGKYATGQKFELKLPLTFPEMSSSEVVADYLKRTIPPVLSYTILLIQAGYSAVGYFEDGEVRHHKTIRTYMVRKKQGKNQLTYSNKGGGRTSSGSQLRYQNGLHFFEDINQTLNDWQATSRPTRIFYSCPVRMWSFLFDSKVKCAFDRKDERLQKIPLYVNTPNYDELLRVNRLISTGFLTFNSVETRTESPHAVTEAGRRI